MAAEELIDIARRVAGPVALAGMAQDHPRSVFLDAGPAVGSKGLGAQDQSTAPGTAPTQVAIPRPRFKFSERSPTQRVLLSPSVIVWGGRKLPRKKTPSPFTPGSPMPKTPM